MKILSSNPQASKFTITVSLVLGVGAALTLTRIYAGATPAPDKTSIQQPALSHVSPQRVPVKSTRVKPSRVAKGVARVGPGKIAASSPRTLNSKTRLAQAAPDTSAATNKPKRLEPLQIDHGPFGELGGEAKPRTVRLELTPKALAADPLQAITPGPAFEAGTLAYLTYAPLEGQTLKQHLLVLRAVGAAGQASSATTYLIKGAGGIVAPQFSPNGDYLLFKVYDGARGPGTFKLYLWNLRTKEVQPGPPEGLDYRLIEWSPDSSFIAYTHGAAPGAAGLVKGKFWTAEAHLDLVIFDVKTGKSRVVAHDKGINHLAWTQQGTLLFSLAPESDGQSVPKSPLLSSIYEVRAPNGEVNPLGKGMSPQPSPDGKFIAFIGQLDPDKRSDVLIPFVCLYDRIKDKRYVGPQESFRELRWTPDSKRLIMIGTASKAAATQAIISTVDMATSKTEKIATITLGGKTGAPAQDVEAATGRTAPRRVMRPRLRPLNVSRDGKSLFLAVREFGAPDDKGFSETLETLQAVDLHDGTVSTLGKFKDMAGYDWIDAAVGPSPQARAEQAKAP